MIKTLTDYHIHTALCKHAAGDIEDYIIHAVKIGLTEIGFADHIPLPGEFDIRHRMEENELETGYLNKIEVLKQKYKDQITIRIGIEADYYPGTEKYVENILRSYPFDFVIGSVHYINDWALDCSEEMNGFHKQNLEKIYKAYFEQFALMVDTKLFDIAGHLDVIKRFGYKPKKGYFGLVEAIISKLKKNNMSVEINTSGLRRPVKEMYPSEDIILLLNNYGIKFTTGSDAHKPEQVGYRFDYLNE
ncbi:histidinol-phosphatase HisJ, partial [candidate division KSB1 bacterium]